MDRWTTLKDWIKKEALRTDSSSVSTIRILEKMREIEESDRREIRAICVQGQFDGEA